MGVCQFSVNFETANMGIGQNDVKPRAFRKQDVAGKTKRAGFQARPWKSFSPGSGDS
jgi:hypothetical protein